MPLGDARIRASRCLTTSCLTPERVLVVAAHPDDIEFGGAGTVARWIVEGARARYLIVTRGDKGSDDPHADMAALAELREREQRAAASEIGVDAVDFLDEPDGQVEATLPSAGASPGRYASSDPTW